mmetsp:Transcript_51594/g.144900  ORF Transcript_51594/g.144900 Transcript_51594/m.144900 type:complete len:244 (+) Transcript_51594:1188-1919(+)
MRRRSREGAQRRPLRDRGHPFLREPGAVGRQAGWGCDRCVRTRLGARRVVVPGVDADGARDGPRGAPVAARAPRRDLGGLPGARAHRGVDDQPRPYEASRGPADLAHRAAGLAPAPAWHAGGRREGAAGEQGHRAVAAGRSEPQGGRARRRRPGRLSLAAALGDPAGRAEGGRRGEADAAAVAAADAIAAAAAATAGAAPPWARRVAQPLEAAATARSAPECPWGHGGLRGEYRRAQPRLLLG